MQSLDRPFEDDADPSVPETRVDFHELEDCQRRPKTDCLLSDHREVVAELFPDPRVTEEFSPSLQKIVHLSLARRNTASSYQTQREEDPFLSPLGHLAAKREEEERDSSIFVYYYHRRRRHRRRRGVSLF